MKVIILIDLGFLKRKYKEKFSSKISSKYIGDFIKHLLSKHGEGYYPLRTYIYDCPPSGATTHLPVSKKPKNFAQSDSYKENTALLEDLKELDFVAVREGILHFVGWVPKQSVLKAGKLPASDEDYSPDFKQKGVDMKIGLDIAWISYEKVAERIIVVTADHDFTPALKVARRHGVQVILSTLGHGIIDELKFSSDVHDSSPLPELPPNPSK